MRRRVIHIIFVLAALAALLAAGYAVAGDDDVDYTAPYLTLENGVLVTKYPDPANDPSHSATKAAVNVQSTVELLRDHAVGSGQPVNTLTNTAIVATTIIVLIVVTATIRGVRRKRGRPAFGAADRDEK